MTYSWLTNRIDKKAYIKSISNMRVEIARLQTAISSCVGYEERLLLIYQLDKLKVIRSEMRFILTNCAIY